MLSELPTVHSTDGHKIIEKLVSFDEDHTDGKPKLIIRHDQDIPDDWIAQLKADKIDPDHKPCGEWLHFATIPNVVYEKMIKAGVDPDHASAKEIVRWLRNEQLDALITTNKRV